MTSLFLHMLVAQTYSNGTYGSLAYNATTSPSPLVSIGPVTLPDTGAGWAVIISALVLAIAGGMAVWAWQRARLRRTNAQTSISS
jgi:hypothetical protein